MEEDLALCVKYEAPVVITSLGARTDVNDAVHSYGGVVMHDVITDKYARKAIEKGADGLIPVAAGAGGHAGTLSPFALVEEIRQWFDGPLALSGAIATGRGVLAARAIGADFAYIGSAFIATKEANAAEGYKRMIAESRADDIVYTNLFTGVHGNYLRPSSRGSGPRSREPAAAFRSVQDEFRFRREYEIESVEGHLGLRTGHRSGRRSASCRGFHRAAQTRIRRGEAGHCGVARFVRRCKNALDCRCRFHDAWSARPSHDQCKQ